MKHPNYTIPHKIYLNSFEPLCMNELGSRAIIKHGHPPFIDASCRREPDLEHISPTISALCRQRAFAPRLRVNDIIVYLSVKRRYFDDEKANNRLIAILQVDKIFETHQDGYNWFTSQKIPVPSNCIVNNNPPYSFDHTSGSFQTKKEIKNFLSKDETYQKRQGQLLLTQWDQKYKTRTSTWKMLVKTKPLYVNFINPTPLLKSDLEIIFDSKIPNTRMPPEIKFHQLNRIASLVGL